MANTENIGPNFEIDFSDRFHFIQSVKELTGLTHDEANTLLWIIEMWDRKKAVAPPVPVDKQ